MNLPIRSGICAVLFLYFHNFYGFFVLSFSVRKLKYLCFEKNLAMKYHIIRWLMFHWDKKQRKIIQMTLYFDNKLNCTATKDFCRLPERGRTDYILTAIYIIQIYKCLYEYVCAKKALFLWHYIYAFLHLHLFSIFICEFTCHKPCYSHLILINKTIA